MVESPSGSGSAVGFRRFTAAPAVLLVALIMVSPWPFGCAHPRATQALSVLASVAALAGLASPAAAAWPSWWRRALLAAGGLWLLAAVQLVPLPPAVHAVVAPASAAVWHPPVAAAVAVLGAGPRPVSLDPSATVRWLAFFGALVGLTLAAREGLRTRTALLRAAVAVVAGALLVAVYGLIARLLFGNKLYGVLDVPTIAPFGPFVSKNHFAGYVELGACLSLGLAAGLADEARRGHEWLGWLDSRRAKGVVAAWGAAATLAISIPASLSRGGVVSLVSGVAAFAFIRAWARPGRAAALRAVTVGALGVVTAIAAVAFLIPDEARARVSSLASPDQASSYRLSVWRDGVRLFTASPTVGSGLGAFAEALPPFKSAAGQLLVEHAENDYLELLCDAGVLGLLLALVAAGTLIVAGARDVRADPRRLPRALRTGALAGLCALAVHSAFDFNLRLPSNALLAALLAACVAAAPEPMDVAGGGGRPRPRRLALLAPAAVVFVLAVAGPWAPAALDLDALRRATSPQRADLRSAALERDVEAHLLRRPADAAAWAALAWLRLPRAPQEADALASWSQALDPQNAALRSATQRIREAAQSQPRRP